MSERDRCPSAGHRPSVISACRSSAAGTGAGGRRHEQVVLVPDEVVLAVHGELVVLAHEDGRHGAGLLAVTAEDTAGLVDLVDLGVPGARLHAAVVLGRLEVDASAGQATEHRPQATHFSRPFSSRIKTCFPRYFGNMGIFWSGYLTVIGLRKRCLNVVAKPVAKARSMSTPTPAHRPGLFVNGCTGSRCVSNSRGTIPLLSTHFSIRRRRAGADPDPHRRRTHTRMV
jgi:hypothetical protein